MEDLQEDDLEAFENWWEKEGSAEYYGYDGACDDLPYRLCKEAWLNGAYVANERKTT